MPKKARELSAIEVKRLAHPGGDNNSMVAVGGVVGLHLQITPTNAKSWVLRTKIGDRRRHIGLGGYPDVPLASARDKARVAREMILEGIDPVEDRKAKAEALRAAQKHGLTFREAKEKFLSAKLAEFNNPKHRKQWPATLNRYADPILGGMPVSDITVADVKRVLDPIWATKNETASRLRGRIEMVLAWATVHGHREGDNPARWKGNLDTSLPKPSKVSKVDHHPAVSLDDAPTWFADLRNRSGTATRALEFAAMTAARSGEVRGATWNEIDLKKRMWIVPAWRMKAGAEHSVPLTDAAIALLKKLPRMAGSEFLFPAARGGALSDAALSACMRRINEARDGGYLDVRSKRPAVPHGLRSTFRDWCAERTDYPYEMAEIALAHAVGSDVERAYRRTGMVEKRRAMMADWASFLVDD